MIRLSSRAVGGRLRRGWLGVVAVAALASLVLGAAPAAAFDARVGTTSASPADTLAGTTATSTEPAGPGALADTVAGVGPVDFECKVTGDAVTGRNDACPAWESDYHTGTDQYAPRTPYMNYNHPVYAAQSKPDDAPSPSAMSPDGRLYFQAIEHGVYGDGYKHLARLIPEIVAFNVDDGSIAWSTDYLGTETSPQGVIVELAVSSDGRGVYAAVQMSSPQGLDFQAVVLAFDAATGDLLWDRYPIVGQSFATDVAVSADSAHVAFTGFDSGARAMVTGMFDAATGQQLWGHTVETPSGKVGTLGARIVAAPEFPTEPNQPAFYAAGVDMHQRDGVWAGNILTFAYGPTGELLWSHRHARPGDQNTGPTYLTTTPDGKRLLYSHELRGDGSDRPEIVAIDASSGSDLWSSRLDFKLKPTGLALDPDGERVYLSGWRQDAWDNPDPREQISGQSTHTAAFRVDDGSQLWLTRLKDRNLTSHSRVVVNPVKAQVHVVARSTEASTQALAGQSWTLVVTYDSITGEQLAVSRYGDWIQQNTLVNPQINKRTNDPWTLAVTPDGGKIISGLEVFESNHPTTSPDPGIIQKSWTTVVAYDTPGAEPTPQ